MILRIEALNYRCLRYIDQKLDDFQVLVGPNASGKTTFLDVVALLGDLVTGGLDHAVEERTRNFQDLVWRRSGDRFELAIELEIPADQKLLLRGAPYDIVRYEVRIGFEKTTNETEILAERVLLKTGEPCEDECWARQLSFFPSLRNVPKSVIGQAKTKNTKTVVNKVRGGNDNFYSEVYCGFFAAHLSCYARHSRSAESVKGHIPQFSVRHSIGRVHCSSPCVLAIS